MRILGISAFYHDSAAALVEDGRIVAAAQEERFTRKKHDPSFPKNAIAYCLEEAGAKLDELDHVVFYDKPFLKFERLMETYIALAPRGFRSFRMAIPLWLKEKLFQKSLLKGELKQFAEGFDIARLLFCEHHLSHAASAFYPSPYEDAVVLTMDGVGEWATTSAAMGSGKNLEVFQEIHFPHSLGLLYSAFTYYTGFKVNSGEYKVMGLAPYGEPKYVKLILDNLIDLKPDGSFRLDMSYFDYCTGLTMTNERFPALFGEPVRAPDKLLTNFHMDVAASIQAVLDEAVLRLTRSLAKQDRCEELVPRWWRGAQLRGQRQGTARWRVREHLDPAGGRRRRWRGRRGAGSRPYFQRPAAQDRTAATPWPAHCLGRATANPTSSAGSRVWARAFEVLDRRRDDRDDGKGAGRSAGGGLVPGPHGVRSALAWRAIDPGRSALTDHAAQPQPEGQVSRELPAIRALGAARGRCRLVRSRLRQPLHADRRRRTQGQAPCYDARRAGRCSASTSSTLRAQKFRR